MKKVELLAPAGNYECLQAAVNAGADAIYLGGEKFGARAFAGNFTTEELIKGIQYAHLFGVRIFLTVNTLVKEKEFKDLFDYINPFYEAGLDGVIIQDIGVFQYLKRHFPGLELHASTQMTLTGVHGAKLLKEMGAVRLVPARELSLQEIRDIHEEVDIEIECFIHGAMCYCYSGQCLFSSILGGRSGNRGRCAQPCRLPYEAIDFSNKKQYPLSLKDMCTIENIAELIEAGITSFKIEGRMKSPEYVAGVTSIYRKVIDRYYQTKQKVKVDQADLKLLNSLYIRSERHNGYYYQHNGKNMVTLSNPAYASSNDAMIARIHEQFLSDIRRVPVSVYFYAQPEEPMVISLDLHDKNINVSLSGAVVSKALNRPMEKVDFEKQLRKTKDTFFEISELQIDLAEGVFVPVKEINALRREAFEQLFMEVTKQDSENRKNQSIQQESQLKTREATFDLTKVSVYVSSLEQFQAVYERDFVRRIYLDFEIAEEILQYDKKDESQEWFLALPYIFRKRSEKLFEKYKIILEHESINGVLVRNQDELGWLSEIDFSKSIQLDAGMYIWNKETKAFYQEQGHGLTVPYELNQHEMRDLDISGMEVICYAHIPMMITANCIYKTYDSCIMGSGNRDLVSLKDRYDKSFPILANCSNCYNVIYNGTVLSLHKYISVLQKSNPEYFRIHFLNENEKETITLLDSFEQLMLGNEKEYDLYMADKEYTNGHFKRGVD